MQKYPIPIEIVEQRLRDVHGDNLIIVRETYAGTAKKATFIDKDYGEYTAWVSNVLKGCMHPLRANEKIKQTNLERYGSEYPLGSNFLRKKIEKTCMDRYGVSNPLCSKIIRENIKNTMIERYGADNPQACPEIRARSSKTMHRSSVHKHWKTGEEVVCVGSYERSVVEWLNKNSIDYEWQVPFSIPRDAHEKIRGRTYFVDLLITSGEFANTYVEIKGAWLRETQKLKWHWFHSTHENSQLWMLDTLKRMKINGK